MTQSRQATLPRGASFLGWPLIADDEIEPGMLVVGGVPHGMTGTQSGAEHGPRAIREGSGMLSWTVVGGSGIVNARTGQLEQLRADVRVGDIGDFQLYIAQVERTTAAISERMEGIVGRGAFPIMLGGDHYISYPLFLGYYNARRAAGERRFGYIQVDSHTDLSDNHPRGGRYWHGSNARRVAELEGVDPRNMVWLGVQWSFPEEWEFVQASGVHVWSDERVHAMGLEQAVARALEIAGDGTDSIYLSVDIDACDYRSAPGTGATIIGGLSDREFLRVMSAFSGGDKIGAIDLVEVSPVKDPYGFTGYLAARGLFEFLRPRLLG